MTVLEETKSRSVWNIYPKVEQTCWTRSQLSSLWISEVLTLDELPMTAGGEKSYSGIFEFLSIFHFLRFHYLLVFGLPFEKFICHNFIFVCYYFVILMFSFHFSSLNGI